MNSLLSQPKLSFLERLGAWLILCFLAFLTLLNLYLNEIELPKETGHIHETGTAIVEVMIKGAVEHPGTYQVQKGAFVEEVLALACPLDNADLKRVNQQSKILRRRTIQVRTKKSNSGQRKKRQS